MKRTVPLLTGLVMILCVGVGHGLWTNRWSTSDEPQRSAAKLSGVPIRIGDWEGRNLPELDDNVLAFGQIAGYVTRVYQKPGTPQGVSAQVLCGRPGPISVHLPNICLGGDGYNQVGELHHFTHTINSDLKVEFMVGQFRRSLEGGAPENIRIFWAMSATGDWKMPRYPRWSYGRYPALFKVYLERHVDSTSEPLEGDLLLQFASQLIPELQKTLFTDH